MVEGVSPELTGFIESLWCDSKANACCSVQLKPCSKAQAREIGQQIEAACIAQGGGHNGITVLGARGGEIDIDPSWDEGETS